MFAISLFHLAFFLILLLLLLLQVLSLIQKFLHDWKYHLFLLFLFVCFLILLYFCIKYITSKFILIRSTNNIFFNVWYFSVITASILQVLSRTQVVIKLPTTGDLFSACPIFVSRTEVITKSLMLYIFFLTSLIFFLKIFKYFCCINLSELKQFHQDSFLLFIYFCVQDVDFCILSNLYSVHYLFFSNI